MKKMGRTLMSVTLAAAVLLTSPFAAMAAQWSREVNGWWYDQGNGRYPASSWVWIDGNNDGIQECYYFEQNGWLLTNTVTPDGNYVNESGAWVVNGSVQTRHTIPLLSTNNMYNNLIGKNYEEIISLFGTPTFDSGTDFWTRQLIYDTPRLTIEIRQGEISTVWAVYGSAKEFLNLQESTTIDKVLKSLEIVNYDKYVSEGVGDFTPGEEGDTVYTFRRNGYEYSIVTEDGFSVKPDSWCCIIN